MLNNFNINEQQYKKSIQMQVLNMFLKNNVKNLFPSIIKTQKKINVSHLLCIYSIPQCHLEKIKVVNVYGQLFIYFRVY